MKLLEIEIIGFGKWQNKKIDFSEGNQLIFGGNEAGKSTIYQFIQAMLFGFPSTKGKSKKDYAPIQGAAYGGYLWLKHPVYGEIKIERFKEKRKGQATVLMPDGVTGDENQLKRILSPLTKEMFQSIFTFQQEQLSELDSLEEDKLQASLLSVGVSGSKQLLDQRESYFKEAQTIYKGKGTQPILNQKLSSYKELSKQIYEKEAKEQTFQTVVQSLDKVKAQLNNTRQEMTLLKEQLTLNEKQQQYYPIYEEWQNIKQIPKASPISSQQEQQLLAYHQQIKLLNEELTRLTYEVSIKSDEPEQAELYSIYLRHEERFKELGRRRYQLENSLSEMEWMNQSYQQNQQELFQIGSKWGWTIEEPPKIFFSESEFNEYREREAQLNVEYNNVQSEVELLQSDIAAREENLSTFEAMNKDIFEKETPKTAQKLAYPIGAIFTSVLAALIGFLLNAPFKIILWGIAALTLILAAYLFFLANKPSNYDHEKKQWRSKLAQLDYLNERLRTAEKKQRKLAAEKNEITQFIKEQAQKNHLGTMNQLDLFLRNRDEVTQYLLVMNTNKELEREIQALDEQLSLTKNEIEQFSSWLPVTSKPLKEQLKIVQQFSEEMEKIRFSQEYQADAYTRQTIRQLKEKEQDLTNEIQPLLVQFAISSVHQIPEKIQALKEYKQKSQREQELKQLLSGLFKSKTSLETLKKQAATFQNELSQLEKSERLLLQEEQENLYQKQQMLADGTLADLYQKREELKTEIEELAVEWAGYKLAGQLLLDLLTELSEQQLPMLLKKMTEFFKLLTSQTYEMIHFNEGKLTVQDRKQQQFSIENLSTGTKDQLIMAVRLAFLAMQEEQLCPVIIDDGWMNYDTKRKEHLSRLLKTFGQNRQIICFSSDKEMVSYYKELSQPINYLEGAENEKN